jgi:chaperonin cofactor prefoldin
MLWDIIQQVQISSAESRGREATNRAEQLEHRVLRLEEELLTTRSQLRRLTEILEQRFGEDLNGDGRVGR